MAKKKDKVKVEPTVYCGECEHFHRDTEGMSFSVQTGEYFMGVSDIGCDPDKTGKGKIFADKPRHCEKYKK